MFYSLRIISITLSLFTVGADRLEITLLLSDKTLFDQNVYVTFIENKNAKLYEL